MKVRPKNIPTTEPKRIKIHTANQTYNFLTSSALNIIKFVIAENTDATATPVRTKLEDENLPFLLESTNTNIEENNAPMNAPIWIDIKGRKGPTYCPFSKKLNDNKYICTIQDTKPKVCKEFWCEWAYGVGDKGIPFRTERGWTDRAKQLGYGETSNRSNRKS